MAEKKSEGRSWDDNLRKLLVSYKWIIAGGLVLVALSQGWISVPLVDQFVGWVREIIAAVTGAPPKAIKP